MDAEINGDFRKAIATTGAKIYIFLNNMAIWFLLSYLLVVPVDTIPV